ncbi:MAG TPA: ABC transporter permease subunit, partial [Clostridia bacterium]|nr:ABC transporter permease subunit [Clostridia bacterium]
VWANVRSGILSTDPLLVEMARAYRVPRLRRLAKLYAPSAFPDFVAACTTGLGFAWKSGVAAEVIANSGLSIGQSLYESKLYLETPELFAWTAAVILLSIVLEKLMLRLLGRLTHD